uniref:Uncharacterized protein n=1 Tax=uncultured prokaryote TaxID=198431 RepID=A0A0H5QP24_9ZZZZ|nr:hypothetical protein [uncultured prokaryote]
MSRNSTLMPTNGLPWSTTRRVDEHLGAGIDSDVRRAPLIAQRGPSAVVGAIAEPRVRESRSVQIEASGGEAEPSRAGAAPPAPGAAPSSPNASRRAAQNSSSSTLQLPRFAPLRLPRKGRPFWLGAVMAQLTSPRHVNLHSPRRLAQATYPGGFVPAIATSWRAGKRSAGGALSSVYGSDLGFLACWEGSGQSSAPLDVDQQHGHGGIYVQGGGHVGQS